MTDKNLSPEQSAALEAFKAAYGATWIQDLYSAWRSGTDVNALPGDQGCYLRQIRNQFGPQWLAQQEGI